MESGWATASRHDVGQVRREVFYFRSGPDLLYASLYRRIRPTTALRVLVCPSWGMEGKQLLQWCHQLARGVSDLGGTGLVVEWPGFEDSEGDPRAATFDCLIDACRHGIAAVHDADGEPWSLAGIRFGATVAVLAGERRLDVPAPALLLAEPVLDPASYFADIERVGRQARLGATGVPGWAFAHPLPEAIREPESAVRVASVLQAFPGRAVIVRHQKPERPAPDGIAVRTVPGSWQRGPFEDHRTLLVTARRWLKHAARRGEGVMTDHPVLIPTTAGVLGGVVTEPDGTAASAAAVILHGAGSTPAPGPTRSGPAWRGRWPTSAW